MHNLKTELPNCLDDSGWPLRWELLMRYRLIEIVALWEGRLTTNHLCNSFGIARQQASKDINAYWLNKPGHHNTDKNSRHKACSVIGLVIFSVQTSANWRFERIAAVQIRRFRTNESLRCPLYRHSIFSEPSKLSLNMWQYLVCH
ncbi:hypothetical protein AGRI_02640 [Alishewanella agri BL06]|uniref:DNA-binding transcriptional repressor CapW winged helix-turn-helix domain-containing protein n=1 Tax=Alishewanella agri BL06 TaxID=1195246 RepID=I8UDG9_9ALTE|nr:hypothetical protein AGRI_02640 [Alishewanella agri BL06]